MKFPSALFSGKKKLQTVIPVAVPVDGNKSDIGDGGRKSEGSIKSKTKGEVIESETVVDIDESNSCESEEDEAKDSATKGRKLNAKVKGKKAYLSWSKGMKLGNLGNFFANSHALISMRKEAVQQKSYFIATQI